MLQNKSQPMAYTSYTESPLANSPVDLGDLPIPQGDSPTAIILAIAVLLRVLLPVMQRNLGDSQ